MKTTRKFKYFMISNVNNNDEFIYVKLPIEYDENKEYECYVINDGTETCIKTKMKFPYDTYLTCQTIYDDPSKDGYEAWSITPNKWMSTLKYWKREYNCNE